MSEEHLWSVLKDPGLGAGRKLASCMKFVGLSLDPTVHSDFWFPGDRSLYLRALARTPGRLLRRG